MEKILYKDSVAPIDFNKNLQNIEYAEFKGIDSKETIEFSEDIEGGNDSIELHLVRTKAYKEAIILSLPPTSHPELWKEFLKEEQKTFGGSKIFYMDKVCTKLLVLSVKNEMFNKLNMVLTRVNKVNERIHRYNTAVKKENQELFEMRSKANLSKKEEIAHFITQHLKV
jgi:uncharacterized protein YdcH (DUF465 family)